MPTHQSRAAAAQPPCRSSEQPGGVIHLGSAQWGCPETGALPFQGFPQHSTRIVAPGLPVLQTSTWSGGVLAPNGKVYMVPNSHSSVLIYDPRTGAVDLSSISGLGDAPAKWLGGVVAGNGRIYCPPDSAGTVLVIDPRRNSTHQLPVPQPGGWAGAVLGVDGRIYCVPMQGNPQSSPPLAGFGAGDRSSHRNRQHHRH